MPRYPRLRLLLTSARNGVAWLLLITAGPAILAAQGIGQGYELERQGKLPQAVDLYRSALRTDSTNLAALLGLERVLPQLGRLAELVPLVDRKSTRLNSSHVEISYAVFCLRNK